MELNIEGKSSRERFWKESSQCREIQLQVKWKMASFHCYDNSDATLIVTNFHLYLIQLSTMQGGNFSKSLSIAT